MKSEKHHHDDEPPEEDEDNQELSADTFGTKGD